MTWKSALTSRSSSRARAGALVVEGHERVVEHERRATVPGDQADESDARREIDRIQRPLAQ
jgi:hypothetical protein